MTDEREQEAFDRRWDRNGVAKAADCAICPERCAVCSVPVRSSTFNHLVMTASPTEGRDAGSTVEAHFCVNTHEVARRQYRPAGRS